MHELGDLFGTTGVFVEDRRRTFWGDYLKDGVVLHHESVGGRERHRTSRAALATVFFRADGTTNDIPLNARSTGPSFSVLRRVPRRICVVSGKSRLLALRGALAAGLVTDLVIDEPSASWLVRSMSA